MSWQIKNIVFDMDGVIADTTACHTRAYAELWKHLNFDGPPYSQIAGRSTKEVLLEWTRQLDPSDQQLSEWVRQKQSAARNYLNVDPIAYDDSASVIAWLAKHFRMAVATSASRDSAHLILQRCGVSTFFDMVVTAEDAKHCKPNPELYLIAMQRCGFQPCDTLIIEDSNSGIDAGLASGAWVVSVRSGLTRNNPRFRFAYNNLDELKVQLSTSEWQD
ncbi:MAG: beta-phosphoglucomutase [Gammaproteobacteria bacterium]|jgi:beta-phosphoglucomutase